VHEIGRQALALQHGTEQAHVAARPLEPAFERGAPGSREELDVVLNLFVRLRLDAIGRGCVQRVFVGFVARGLGRGRFDVVLRGFAQSTDVCLEFGEFTARRHVGIERHHLCDALERPLADAHRNLELA